jgi:acyl-CoA thioesterase
MPDAFQAIKLYFENDHYAAATGIRLDEVRLGFAKASMPIEGCHLNSVGIVHGGAIFTLADLAFAAASNSAGRVAVAISTSLSFMKATRSGVLCAEATEISRTRRLSVCTVRVTNDAGESVALFQGTAYIKDEPFPPDIPPPHR